MTTDRQRLKDKEAHLYITARVLEHKLKEISRDTSYVVVT